MRSHPLAYVALASLALATVGPCRALAASRSVSVSSHVSVSHTGNVSRTTTVKVTTSTPSTKAAKATPQAGTMSKDGKGRAAHGASAGSGGKGHSGQGGKGGNWTGGPFIDYSCANWPDGGTVRRLPGGAAERIPCLPYAAPRETLTPVGEARKPGVFEATDVQAVTVPAPTRAADPSIPPGWKYIPMECEPRCVWRRR